MQSVKMKRVELLDIVRENAKKHIIEYDQSVIDYKAAVIKVAEENLRLANTGDIEQIVKMRSAPQRPQHYADNYSRAIRMLELSVEDTIDVEEHIFNQLVLDEWGWKQSFAIAAQSYKTV